MEVVLLKDVENLGLEGEIKKVKKGYARNFLFPRKLAVEATESTMKNLALRLKSLEESRKRKIATASEKKKLLESLILEITAKAGEKGKLFGSITTSQVAEKLAEAGFNEFDKKHIRIPHIKEVGTYTASVKVIESIYANVKINIIAEKEEEKTEFKRSSKRNFKGKKPSKNDSELKEDENNDLQNE